MKKIMIVEDEIFMREELNYILENEGYDTVCIDKFINVSEKIISTSPDLILLDLNLPGISGFEICKKIRSKSNVPILVLTGRDQIKDELHALNIGADDYINKPCHKDRLLARINNLLRRLDSRKNFIELSGISLDLRTHTLAFDGKAVILPENQGKIIELLLENYNGIVTKEMLFQKLWGTEEYVDENALYVNITRLKKSLDKIECKYKINTIRGKGYSLEYSLDEYND